MRFNKSAFTIGFVFVISLNILLCMIMFSLFAKSYIIFIDYMILLHILYTIPIILINLAWFWYAFKFFDNGESSDSMATPDGFFKDSIVSKFEVKNHKTKYFLILGSLIALVVSGFIYYANYADELEEIKNYKTTSLKLNVKSSMSPKLKSLSTMFENSIKSTPNLLEIKTGSWEKVYTSDLSCFEPFKTEIDDSIELYKTDNGYNNQTQAVVNVINDPQYKDFIDFPLYYEYWIDPDDKQHVKIRFLMDVKQRTENILILPNTPATHTYYYTSVANYGYSYPTDIIDDWATESEYLIYDSNSGSAEFENDGFFSLIANNPSSFFTLLINPILTIIVLVLIIRFGLKDLSEAKFLKGQKKYVRNYKINRKKSK